MATLSCTNWELLYQPVIRPCPHALPCKGFPRAVLLYRLAVGQTNVQSFYLLLYFDILAYLQLHCQYFAQIYFRKKLKYFA